MGQEIERKFKISKEMADEYMKRCKMGEFRSHDIEQAYLTVNPVIRVRKSDDEYYMTYKGSGLMSREEYNLPLTREAYDTLKSKAEGNVIKKTRILIPYEKYTIELDVFKEPFENVIIAEVEFGTEDEARSFITPDWFMEDVTEDRKFHNSNMSRAKIVEGESYE